MLKLALFICLLAIPCELLSADRRTTATATLPPQGETLRAQTKSAIIAEIEAYCRGLDQYFDRHQKERRYFVDSSPEGQEGWYELKSMDEVENAEGNYAHRSIIVSLKAGEIAVASIGEPREHSRHDDIYYFHRDGTLVKIVSSFRSNNGNARYLRKIFYDGAGNPLSSSTVCYEIYPKEKKTSCKRGYVREQLDDHRILVYRTNKELPVYETLKKR